MNAVSTTTTPHNLTETSKIVTIPSSRHDSVPHNEVAMERLGEMTLDTTASLISEALNVDEDMYVVASLIPKDGYNLRNNLIFGSEDLTAEQKLTESYRNDLFYATELERASNSVNRMRDNKTKNLGKTLGIGVGALIVVVSFAAGNPNIRAKILKWAATKVA